MDSTKRCSIDGCGRRRHERNWCGMHYERWRKHGDVLWEPKPLLLVKTGERRVRLVALETTDGKFMRVRCDCGTELSVQKKYFLSGNTKSCGCLQRDKVRTSRTTHGDKGARLYAIWTGMRQRCHGPGGDSRFNDYGGRGISVCDEWRNSYVAFKNWAMTNGYEDDLTIDRIDVNGDYFPRNCRFIPMGKQARNKRNTRYVTAFGETKPLPDWCDDERCVVSYIIASARLYRGWKPELAFSLAADSSNSGRRKAKFYMD